MSDVPAAWRRLVDDAAIFPPGNALLRLAVQAHRRHRGAAYADLVGPFVVDDLRLPELVVASGEPLAVTVVVKGGVGAVEAVLGEAGSSAALDLRSIEVAVQDVGDLGVLGAVESTLVFVEPPRLAGAPAGSWLRVLDGVAQAGHRLKFRTGGLTADAFPDSTALATSIHGALERRVAFKCTAGLHHAVRHRDDRTGFEQHGFLNVLVATAAALGGAAITDLAGLLDERDAVTLLRAVSTDELVSARRWFTSFGCCDVLDPLRDLIELDLLSDISLEHA